MLGKYLRQHLVAKSFNNSVITGKSITLPTTLYAGLAIKPTGNDWNALMEIGSNGPARGYARVPVATDGTVFSLNTALGMFEDMVITNTSAIVFPDADGTGDWGTAGVKQAIELVVLFDTATIGTGDIWWYSFIPPKFVESTTKSPSIPVGGFKYTF